MSSAIGSTYVRWSGLYEFRIRADGSRVACRPLNGSDRAVLQNFLFGQALSFALVHQGHRTVARGRRSVSRMSLSRFLGDCTFGKSTLLASFLQAGHQLVTDDLLMLAGREGDPVALPGTGRIKLHPDSARIFLDDATAGEPLNPLTLKRSFPMDSSRVQITALPLTHLFVLPTPEERRRTSTIDIRPLSRAELFHALLKGTFNSEILTRDRIERQFECAAHATARHCRFSVAATLKGCITCRLSVKASSITSVALVIDWRDTTR